MQVTFFLISAYNSKCVMKCCSRCFVLYNVLCFIPFLVLKILLQSAELEHIEFCLIQCQIFMSSVYLPLLTCKHYFVHSFYKSISYTHLNMLLYK
jgi:hypothetical protein